MHLLAGQGQQADCSTRGSRSRGGSCLLRRQGVNSVAARSGARSSTEEPSGNHHLQLLPAVCAAVAPLAVQPHLRHSLVLTAKRPLGVSIRMLGGL